MQYLGLDRLNPAEKRFIDQEEEDAFCLSLLRIGGKWWPNEKRAVRVGYELSCISSGMEDETDEEMMQAWIGWPEEGGLLVAEHQSRVGNIKTPEEVGRLRMVFTNRERCDLLRNRFGAVFYKDPKDYAGFANHRGLVNRRCTSSTST